MVHALRTNVAASEDFMAVKTDMSKAYDIVEWCFLEKLMEKLGFDSQWIKWIMYCVSSVTYSVLINDKSHDFIKLEREIIQGDPLSPFLFIICVEALVNLLNKFEARGDLSGERASASGPVVHLFLFVDDSLLLCKANGGGEWWIEKMHAVVWECLGSDDILPNIIHYLWCKGPQTKKDEVKLSLGMASLQKAERELTWVSRNVLMGQKKSC